MHFNYEFCLDYVCQANGPSLDFGCGRGEILRAGLARGANVYGVDIFYDASINRVEDLLGTRVFEISDGLIPFPDGYFSVIVSNQVFEHVEDIGKALAEIRRVLAPDGIFVSLFPSLEVIREGHCGVWFSHRLVKHRRLFDIWLSAWYLLGFGYARAGLTRKKWLDWAHSFLTTKCFYRPSVQISSHFEAAGLSFRQLEGEYQRRRWGRKIMPNSIFRLAAHMVIESKSIRT